MSSTSDIPAGEDSPTLLGSLVTILGTRLNFRLPLDLLASGSLEIWLAPYSFILSC
jgi:hypothetical protein